VNSTKKTGNTDTSVKNEDNSIKLILENTLDINKLIKYIINVRLIAVIPDKNVMKDKID
jgi:hypothetical protein